MWDHGAVQHNVATLRARGVHVLDPDVGHLAGGDAGAGRLPDPARIVDVAFTILSSSTARRDGSLAGRRVLVTAGGTREAIDPVRYIGNRSSGKMGHAVAAAAARAGAAVVLVTTRAGTAPAGVDVVAVDSAQEMHDAVMARAAGADAIVMAAAVADFRPKAVADQKIKKGDGPPEILLEPTPDILAALGAHKPAHQVLVGFAAETERVREHAQQKLTAKRVDFIVANDVSAPDSGFEVDTNRAILLESSGSIAELPLLSKDALGDEICARIAARLVEHDKESE
jgi:phosphopantothenoylcysteine decarboxylase/phosphopantothenate--cysteine ligase